MKPASAVVMCLLALAAGGDTVVEACSCATYPAAFCARDLDALNPSETSVFLGRITHAGLTFFDLPRIIQEEFQRLAPEQIWPPDREAQRSPAIQEALQKASLLASARVYGSRLSPEQLRELADPNSPNAPNVNTLLQRAGRPVEFEVVESFTGELPAKFTIFTGDGGGDCGVPFKQDETYLVEARQSEGKWRVSVCSSRVSPEAGAAEDLRTLRAWKRGETVARRVYGSVDDWTSRVNKHPKKYPPAIDARLALVGGDKELEAVTDSEGRFRFENIPPGNYTLALRKPGWSLHSSAVERTKIDLETFGCAEAWVTIEQDQGAIRGRLESHPGETLPEYLWIEAIPVEGRGSPPFDGTARAETGSFEIDKIEPGDYYVAINVNNSPAGPRHPSAPHGRLWPYPPTYYPGVSDPSEAAAFHVERGQSISLADWVLPPRLSERFVSGIAILPDGAPAPDARLILRRPGLNEIAERIGPTSNDGRFEAHPLESLEYVLEAAVYDPATHLVYRGSVVVSAESVGSLTIQLEATDEKSPDDHRFFRSRDWERE